MRNRGFSLVELVVALAIVGILGTIATMQFNRMSRKAEGEREIRDLQAALFSARLISVQQRKRHGVRVGNESIAFLRYTSEDEAGSGGTVLSVQPLRFPVADGSGKKIDGQTIEFDTKGISSVFGQTIRLADASISESLDCVVVSRGRVNSGKMKGDSCDGK